MAARPIQLGCYRRASVRSAADLSLARAHSKQSVSAPIGSWWDSEWVRRATRRLTQLFNIAEGDHGDLTQSVPIRHFSGRCAAPHAASWPRIDSGPFVLKSGSPSSPAPAPSRIDHNVDATRRAWQLSPSTGSARFQSDRVRPETEPSSNRKTATCHLKSVGRGKKDPEHCRW